MGRLKHTAILSLLIVFSVSLYGQSSKLVKKADKMYYEGNYASAIPIYKNALKEKEHSGTRTKLAECYRRTNQIDNAKAEYEIVMRTARKIRPRTKLRFGEVLLASGEYSKARKMFSEYLDSEPEDDQIRELHDNMDRIQEIEDFYDEAEVSKPEINTDADETGAVFVDDGIVFASDRKRPANFFKEKTGRTGRDFLALYYAPIYGDREIGQAEILPKKINSLNKNTGPASFTSDGEIMVFSRNNEVPSQAGKYYLQLYIATKENGRWKNVEKLPFCNESSNYMHPAISPDGHMIFFVSDKSGGEGGTDIYMVRKDKEGWSKPMNLGDNVNTKANEGFPYFHRDGRLFFCSKGHVGFGGFDVYFTKPVTIQRWEDPTNLGQPINSSRDDISFSLHPDGNYGFFTSSREGDNDDIYCFTVDNQEIIVADSHNQQSNQIEEKKPTAVEETRTIREKAEFNPPAKQR